MPDTPTPRTPKTVPERIASNLKGARKLAGPEFDQNPARVAFMLQEARILATLDVAAAARGDQEPS
jgi:hypothetical protein